MMFKVFVSLSRFSGSLTGMANVSNHTKYVSLNCKPCFTKPTLIYDYNNSQNV